MKSASSHSEFRARFVGFVNANNHPAQDQKFFQPQYCIRILAFCDGDDSMSAARFLPRLHSACPQPAQPFQAVPNQRALVQHNEYSVMRTRNIRLSLQSELIVQFLHFATGMSSKCMNLVTTRALHACTDSMIRVHSASFSYA